MAVEIDTEFNADTVAFCPISGYEKFVAVGTYQVLGTSDEGLSKTIHRTGLMFTYQVSMDSESIIIASEMQRMQTSAILDIEW